VPALKSFALVSRWGGQALVYHHHDGKRFVKAPRGWRWHQDDNGLRLISRSSPTDDFHPNSDDLLKGTGYLLKRAVALRQTRRAEAARSRREINLLVGHAPGVRVCLQDSLNAGNCETGTLEFARRHGLDPEFYYTPTKLLKLEPGNQRVKLAIAFAARRHAQLAATGITVRYPKARRQRRP